MEPELVTVDVNIFLSSVHRVPRAGGPGGAGGVHGAGEEL